jgi:hypothetical protein
MGTGFQWRAARGTLLWPPQGNFSSVARTKPVDQASARCQIPWIFWFSNDPELGQQTPPLDSAAGAIQGWGGGADRFYHGGASIHRRASKW